MIAVLRLALLLHLQRFAKATLMMQGKDTSKIAGLSCRSGRVVLAGDRNYNPVPITMILKEHEDDTRGLLLLSYLETAAPLVYAACSCRFQSQKNPPQISKGS